ncbi:MAG TPA: triphosphoribosyl-dephospho-CoA synthetase [Planctomycetales bacterium]|nr:triphosphoribosyl-dephospho-CoA synthetase [Planctomycetales bacterium]
MTDRDRETIGLHAQLACIWEATARKPGNVHRFVDFDDLSYLDFLTCAAAVAPVLAAAPDHRVGHTVLEGVRRTRQVVRTNSNLGILLLVAPLAKAAAEPDLRTGLVRVLDDLDVEDSRLVYEAIRLANPGGLGQVSKQDIKDEPTLSLRAVMVLAADRDLIARQYANGFREVFDDGVPAVLEGMERTGSLEGAIIYTHLCLMARHPDTLIARKRGAVEAMESAMRARAVLDKGWPHKPKGRDAFADLDAWLRAEGRRRNPGTTADMIAACLFVLLRERKIVLPLQCPWSRA